MGRVIAITSSKAVATPFVRALIWATIHAVASNYSTVSIRTMKAGCQCRYDGYKGKNTLVVGQAYQQSKQRSSSGLGKWDQCNRASTKVLFLALHRGQDGRAHWCSRYHPVGSTRSRRRRVHNHSSSYFQSHWTRSIFSSGRVEPATIGRRQE